MLSNLEQAITNVLAAQLAPNYGNVLDAYIQISDINKNKSARAIPLYFDRAIEKYPDPKEKLYSPFAQLVKEIRKQQLNVTIDTAVKLFGNEILLPCPCNCGSLLSAADIRKELAIEDEEDQVVEPIVKRTKAKKLKYRRLNNKGGSTKTSRKAVRSFDPFGPSTSRASM